MQLRIYSCDKILRMEGLLVWLVVGTVHLAAQVLKVEVVSEGDGRREVRMK